MALAAEGELGLPAHLTIQVGHRKHSPHASLSVHGSEHSTHFQSYLPLPAAVDMWKETAWGGSVEKSPPVQLA